MTDELDYTPHWKGNIGADFKLHHTSTLSLRGRYVGERHTVYLYRVQGATNYKLMKLDSFITADAEVKLPVFKHAELGFYVENLFDKKYEERFGYPLPGRIIGGAMKITL